MQEAQKMNNDIYLEPFEEMKPHLYTIIFLHGLGDSAEGFKMWLGLQNPYFFGTTFKNCRVIYPQAPFAKVTANGNQ